MDTTQPSSDWQQATTHRLARTIIGRQPTPPAQPAR